MKPRVAVLRGGPSAEYPVSMKTGAAVLGAFSDSDFEPIDVTISRAGEWLLHGFPRKPQDILSSVDAAFLALHGAYGEDGTVQRLLQMHHVPFTGSAAYPSSVAMNKVLTKEYLQDLPIQMPAHMRVTAGRNTDIPRLVNTLTELLGNECVVKPVSGGSSLDTYVVSGYSALLRTLTDLLKTHDEVLVEERIRGREATCGVVERFRDESLYALPIVEIIPPDDATFFSYDAKYSGVTAEIYPGRFSEKEKEAITAATRLVHKTLGLSQYSRSDFIVSENGIYFLEVNTLPDLREDALFPKSIAAVGSSHRELVHHLVTDSLRR